MAKEVKPTHKSIPAAVPMALYERMEAIKQRFGVPYNKMVNQALEKHVTFLEEELSKTIGGKS